MVKKNIKKEGWHDFKYGNIHERRLYGKHGKVLAKIPIKSGTRPPNYKPRRKKK